MAKALFALRKIGRANGETSILNALSFVLLALASGLSFPVPASASGAQKIFSGFARPLGMPFEVQWNPPTLGRHSEETLLRHSRLLREAASWVSELPPPSVPFDPFSLPTVLYSGHSSLSVLLSDEGLDALYGTGKDGVPFQLIPPAADVLPFTDSIASPLEGGSRHLSFVALLRLDVAGGLTRTSEDSALGDGALLARYFAYLYSFFYGTLAFEIESPKALYGIQSRFRDSAANELETSLRLLRAFDALVSKESTTPAEIKLYLKKTYLPMLRVRQKRLEKEFRSASRGETFDALSYAAPSVIPVYRSAFLPEEALAKLSRAEAAKAIRIANSGLKFVGKLLSHSLDNSPFLWREDYQALRRKVFKPQLLRFSDWEASLPEAERAVSEPQDGYFALVVSPDDDPYASVATLTFFFDRIFADPVTHQLYPDAETRWGLALARAYSGAYRAYLLADPYSLPSVLFPVGTDSFSRRLRNQEFQVAGHMGALAWFGAMVQLGKVPSGGDTIRTREIALFVQAAACAQRLLKAPFN